MKTIKIILFLSLSISVLQAEAVNLHRAYYRDRNVDRFQETGTIEDFAAMDDDYKAFALSNLLINPDGNPNDRDAVIVRDRSAIYKKFLDTATPEQQLNIFTEAFNLATSGSYAAQARDVFNRVMASKPSSVGKMICDTIKETQIPDVSAGDDEDIIDFDLSKLPDSTTVINGLLPYIAQSGSSNINCDFGSEKKPRPISIAEIVSHTSQDLYAKLYNLSREAQAANLRVQSEYSKCSVAQVRTSLFSGLTILKDLKVGISQYIITNDNGCVINGLIKKVKVGYEFYPSNGIAGYQKKSFNFTNLEQIVQLMKPTMFVLKSPTQIRPAAIPLPKAKELTADPKTIGEKTKMSQFGDLIKYFTK